MQECWIHALWINDIFILKQVCLGNQCLRFLQVSVVSFLVLCTTWWLCVAAASSCVSNEQQEEEEEVNSNREDDVLLNVIRPDYERPAPPPPIKPLYHLTEDGKVQGKCLKLC